MSRFWVEPVRETTAANEHLDVSRPLAFWGFMGEFGKKRPVSALICHSEKFELSGDGGVVL